MLLQTRRVQKTLLMLGDSLIEWGDWEHLLPDFRVINRGIAGEHTEEFSARLGKEIDAVVDSGIEPEYILLMTGTNNLLMGSMYFPVILGSMLPRLVGYCPQGSIILNSIMPMQVRDLPQRSITTANNELHDAARQNNCSFLDMTGPFTEHCLPITIPCFLSDGVHLSTRGYQVWAEAIRKHLAAL